MTRPLHPWTDPKGGDVAVTAFGRRRTVRQIHMGSWGGQSFVSRVAYETEKGALRTCEGVTWATWCRRFANRYERDGVDLLQQAAEAALASGEDHL